MKNYSFLSKILHRQFLNDKNIINFQINILKNKSIKFDLKNCRYIFITGLARSGSTALLQAFDSTKIFSSMRYKYMPFILSPRIAQIYSTYLSDNENLERERLHGDGLKINTNSAESLDEPYWINTIYKNIDTINYLYPHEVTLDCSKGYGLLLNYYLDIEKRKRLIIKNNNNHLRIISLSSHFPNSTFLILFRNPLAHSKSLLNTHKKFIYIQNKDRFVLEYMNLIGHWEFGKGKKSFIYDETQKQTLNSLESLDIEYWLKQWIFTYQWILEVTSNSNLCNKKNIKLVCYEDLCKNKKYKKTLFDELSISKDDYNFTLGKSNYYYETKIKDKMIIDEANYIYEKLRKKSLYNLEF